MSSSVQMTTHTQFGGGGGFFGALKRVAGGGSLFMTEYRAVGVASEVAFATKLPGHIVPVEVSPGHDFMIHHHASYVVLHKSKSASAFSSRLGAAFSAAMDSYCSV